MEDEYADWSNSQEQISASVQAAFIRALPRGSSAPVTGKAVNRVTHQGISYTMQAIHEGNSGVIRKGSDTPLCIEKIFEFPESSGKDLQDTWLVVRRHKVTGSPVDPYLNYPLLRARMWDPELEPDIDVLPLLEVDAHFAKCVIPWKGKTVAVVVSLSRVRPMTNTLMPAKGLTLQL